jgi:hypothetical protein
MLPEVEEIVKELEKGLAQIETQNKGVVDEIARVEPYLQGLRADELRIAGAVEYARKALALVHQMSSESPAPPEPPAPPESADGGAA